MDGIIELDDFNEFLKSISNYRIIEINGCITDNQSFVKVFKEALDLPYYVFTIAGVIDSLKDLWRREEDNFIIVINTLNFDKHILKNFCMDIYGINLFLSIFNKKIFLIKIKK